ncbi:MAG: zinc-dependent metalloprotease [Balneolaceae bacterium]
MTRFATAFLFTLLFAYSASAQNVIVLNPIDSHAAQPLLAQSSTNTEPFFFDFDPAAVDKILTDDGTALLRVYSSSAVYHDVEIFRTASFTPNTRSIIAGDPSNPGNLLTLTLYDDSVVGFLHTAHNGVFELGFAPDTQQHFISTASGHDVLECGLHELGDGLPPPRFEQHAALMATSNATPGIHTPNVLALAGTLEDNVTIDVLIAYTQKAEDWALQTDGSGNVVRSIESVIAQAMANSQAALDNSNVFITLRLVHFYKTDYNDDETETTAGEHLRRFTENPAAPRFGEEFEGYMEEVHTLRNQFGADLVALIASEPKTGGIAWLKGTISGGEDLAFSVNRVQQMANSFTLVHEFGHNLGSLHARNQPTAAASPRGGLFKYSTGNRFNDGPNLFATVMAYTTNGYQRIPHFSNPQVFFSGQPTGRNFGGDAGPANSARAFREVKRAIAAYRPTMVNPPTLAVLDTGIEVTVSPDGEPVTVPVQITNNGQSDLLWDVDFDVTSQTLSQGSLRVTNMHPLEEELARQNQNLQRNEKALPAAFQYSSFSQNGDIIYSTDFETGPGGNDFKLGDHELINLWRTSGDAGLLEISDQNPASGTTHLRLPTRPGTNQIINARSPYVGPLPFGQYEIEVDLAVSQNTPGENQRFDFLVFDAKTDGVSSAVIFFNGGLFTANLNESGQVNFTFTGANYAGNGTYERFRIVYNTTAPSIDYYLDDELLASGPFLPNTTPDFIQIRNYNDVQDAVMDVDNLTIRQVNTPFEWLDVDRYGAVTQPGSSHSLQLTFSSEGLDEGTYSSVMLINSNDPNNPQVEVPVTLNVELATSTERDGQNPVAFQLNQNYPNPFNPSTIIPYSLSQSAHVQIAVYDMLGRRVTTLIDEQRPAGSHTIQFDASNLASGVYMYRLQTASQVLSRQMVLIK